MPDTQTRPVPAAQPFFESIEGGISSWWQGGSELQTGVAKAGVDLVAGFSSDIADFFSAISATLKESPHAVGYVVGGITIYSAWAFWKRLKRGYRA